MKRLAVVLAFELLILAALLVITRANCGPGQGICAAAESDRSASRADSPLEAL